MRRTNGTPVGASFDSVRSYGVIASTQDLGVNDHLCWIYDGHTSFLAEAVEFLAEGVRLGQRISYVGDHSLEQLRPYLARLGDVDALVAAGQFSVLSIAAVYEPVRYADAVAQAEVYAAAVANAMAAGFDGLRVAADATSLVESRDGLDEFARYEHVVDRLMAEGLRFSAMCGYDGSVLDASAAHELASIHPLTGGTDPTFAIFAVGDGVVAAVGEIDAMNASTFGTTVERILAVHPSDIVTLDGSGLAFIDHNGLLALDRAAASKGVRLRLVGAPGVAIRLSTIVRFAHLEVSGR